MTRVVIDRSTFKALASDTRLRILKTLDGRKMNLSELARSTGLSKTTILEHMEKLMEAGLVKKIEREGHKWTYYKLSWKGSSLLHPDNVKIVITFCISLFLLLIGVSQLIVYGNGFHVLLNEKIPYAGEGQMKTLGADERTNVSLEELKNVISEDFLRTRLKDVTILNLPPSNVYVSSFEFTESLNNTKIYCEEVNETIEGKNFTASGMEKTEIRMDVFYQDPFYLYGGISALIVSMGFLIVLFKMFWKRKNILEILSEGWDLG